MENNMKEMDMEEMDKVAGGLRIEILTDAEKEEYNRLLDRAKRKGMPQKVEFGFFLQKMRNKYGDAVLDDYEAGNERWALSHYTLAE